MESTAPMQKVDKSLLGFLARLQTVVAKLVVLQPLKLNLLRFICGVDVAYSRSNACAASVIWSLSEKAVIEVKKYIASPSFPYIPGLLFMREAPLIFEVLGMMKRKADLILVDGHGVAHPRRAGLAVFVGLMSDTPTVGVAKSILVGEVSRYVDNFASITLDGLKVGYAVKPRGVKPYYMSPGYKVEVEDLKRLLQLIGLHYPKPLLEAHKLSKEGLRGIEAC